MKRLFTRLFSKFRIFYHLALLHWIAGPRSRQTGFNVFGYISKVIGQGEVARSFVDELIRNGDQFVLVDFYDNNHKRITRQEEEPYRKYYYKKLKFNKNIFFIDLMQLREVRRKIPVIFQNKQNIVTFWWEFESGFEERIPILNEFNEVYVFSDFIRNVLNSVENKNFRVTKIKYPFTVNWHITDDPVSVKRKYDLLGRFCFFFNFDYLSSYQRKNPEAILRALAEEFSNEQNVVFIAKTNNSERSEEKEKVFRHAVQALGLSSRVHVFKEPLTRNEFMTLLNAMDCYISLHRGEGLGLGILEALALNKPVIATNYGGNSEYMNHALAYAVPYALIPANDDYGPYRHVKYWAEPDLARAKYFMRSIYSERKNLTGSLAEKGT